MGRIKAAAKTAVESILIYIAGSCIITVIVALISQDSAAVKQTGECFMSGLIVITAMNVAGFLLTVIDQKGDKE